MIKNSNFPLVTEKDKLLPFYLLGIGCDYIQELVERPDGYPTFQWIQSVSGGGEVELEGRKESINEHQGIFLFPSVQHKYYSSNEEWKVHWVSFEGSGVEQFLKAAGIRQSAVYFVKNAELISTKMRRILSISQSPSSMKNIEASSILYELLMDIIMYASIISDDSTEQQYLKLSQVFKYIEENYSKLITLEDLAVTINVTPQHLCLLFKNITNMRPFEYVNKVRISKSKDLIINDCHSEIKEIATSVGYENTSYFCSVFKGIEGISPGKFKKLYW